MPTEIMAVGMIEFNSIAAGIEAADAMVKASSVEPLMLKTICPGKFVCAVNGDVSSVQAAVDAGLAMCGGTAVDHFVIPNINHAVISAMACALEPAKGPALGIIETFSAASVIQAADAASKAANVVVAEVRIAMGLGGKAFAMFSGDIAAVNAAVDAGAAMVAEAGMLVRKVVVPSIDPGILSRLM